MINGSAFLGDAIIFCFISAGSIFFAASLRLFSFAS
jgi:hypothetical protein